MRETGQTSMALNLEAQAPARTGSCCIDNSKIAIIVFHDHSVGRPQNAISFVEGAVHV
jgi:hypothetical protein